MTINAYDDDEFEINDNEENMLPEEHEITDDYYEKTIPIRNSAVTTDGNDRYKEVHEPNPGHFHFTHPTKPLSEAFKDGD